MSRGKGGAGNAPNGQRTNAAAIEQTERVAKAIAMRCQGHSYADIAKSLGWESRQAAFEAVDRALKETLSEPATELRTLELEKLMAQERVLWPMANAKDMKAHDMLLKISKRRAKLLGLDAPTRLANADGSNLGPTEIRVVMASQATQEPQA